MTRAEQSSPNTNDRQAATVQATHRSHTLLFTEQQMVVLTSTYMGCILSLDRLPTSHVTAETHPGDARIAWGEMNGEKLHRDRDTLCVGDTQTKEYVQLAANCGTALTVAVMFAAVALSRPVAC